MESMQEPPGVPQGQPVITSALYKFVGLQHLQQMQQSLRLRCEALGIKGTLLLAPEGINGTVAGRPQAVAELLSTLRQYPGLEDLQDKQAPARAMPFHRLKVRIKREIVTLRVPEVDPTRQAGTYVKPADWNALISEPGVVVVDVRNDYEVALGSFEGALNPHTRSFAELPEWVATQRQPGGVLHGQPKVAMFCTGGIRCEKSTAFMRLQGFEQVYHLEGGILKYLETVPPEASRWQGECFVFDERVSVGYGVLPGAARLCRACRHPITEAECASPHYQEGVSCPHCHDHTTPEQKAAYAERHRQVALAQSRAQAHIGAVQPGH
jgi:UPF0176 protein